MQVKQYINESNNDKTKDKEYLRLHPTGFTGAVSQVLYLFWTCLDIEYEIDVTVRTVTSGAFET